MSDQVHGADVLSGVASLPLPPDPDTAQAQARRPAGRIALLTAGGPLGTIAAAALAERFPGLVLIEEQPEGRRTIVRRRARLLGWPVALGQLANGLALRLIGRNRRRRRLAQIHKHFGFASTLPPGLETHRVTSVNAPECQALLKRLAPTVVAVYGTRLLSRATLAAAPAPFINYHAGINPKYRGQDPAYWALVAGDAENAGITIHLVDEGVDTGSVLYQARVAFSPDDTIGTYQFVQMGHAIDLFARAIADAREGRLAPVTVDLPSNKWFPPPVWTYLWNGLRHGVW